MFYVYSKLVASSVLVRNPEILTLGHDLLAGYWRHTKPAYRLGEFLTSTLPLDSPQLAQLCFDTLASSASEKRKNLVLIFLTHLKDNSSVFWNVFTRCSSVLSDTQKVSILRQLKVSILMDSFDNYSHRPILEQVLLKFIFQPTTFENEMLSFSHRHLEKASKILALCLLRQEFSKEVLRFFLHPHLGDNKERLIIETTRELMQYSSEQLAIEKNTAVKAFFKQHTRNISMIRGFSFLDDDTATMLSDWKDQVISSRGKLSSDRLHYMWDLLKDVENVTDFPLVYEAGWDIVKNINFRSFKDEGNHDVLIRLYALYARPLPKLKTKQLKDNFGFPLSLGKTFDLGRLGRLYYVTSQGAEKHGSRLGFGAYCVVRLGVLVDREGHEKLVAIKKYEHYFKRIAEDKPPLSRKLEVEYRILKSLNKKRIPGIPEVYYYGVDSDGKHHVHRPHERQTSRDGKVGNKKEFYVMELLGDSMERKLNRGMTFESRCEAVFSVLATLKGLRDVGLVHLDFKFSNLLSTSSGKWKITDFGVSSNRGSAIPAGSISGSGGFFAPEQRGFSSDESPVFSSRIDLYGFGMMLAYLFLSYPSAVPQKDIPKFDALLYSEGVETVQARHDFICNGVPMDAELGSSQGDNVKAFKKLLLNMTKKNQIERTITYEEVEKTLERILLPMTGK